MTHKDTGRLESLVRQVVWTLRPPGHCNPDDGLSLRVHCLNGGIGGQVWLDPVPDHVPDFLHLGFRMLHTCDRPIPSDTHQDLPAICVGKGYDLLFEVGVDDLLELQNWALSILHRNTPRFDIFNIISIYYIVSPLIRICKQQNRRPVPPIAHFLKLEVLLYEIYFAMAV